MKKQPFLPIQESKKVLWFNNFSGKLKDTYAALFGISSGDADKIVAYAAFYAFLISYLTGLRTFTQDLTKYKNDFFGAPLNTPNGALPAFSVTPPAIIPTEAGVYNIISPLIQTIKSHTNYTTAIGEDLGIVGNEQDIDLDTYKPEGKVFALPGAVKLDFSKKGVDGQAVYSRPVGSTDPNAWVKLANDFHTPYLDGRPLAVAGKPELREYKLRALIGDEEVGQWSDVITVTFAG
jgi:hypothetical protein